MGRCLTLLFLLLLYVQASSQTCTNPGQTPETAQLLCGEVSIDVSTVTFCGNKTLPIPCADGYPYRNLNPTFFRMICFQSGPLGFSILPADLNSNFSWALYDITSTNPADAFTNPNLLVACNWSSEPGETGASQDGVDPIVCSGATPRFSSMPNISQGRTYMLMVVNESASTQPYHLTIAGGGASITDPVEPDLMLAGAVCNSNIVWVKLNKQLLCNYLSQDGSEFTISGGAVINGALPGICTSLFGSDSVYLYLSAPLPYGNYQLTINNGTDGNTLGDLCNRFIPANNSISFTVGPQQPTPMDSIKPSGCIPGYIELQFKKPIQCSSIAPDGSDFVISGPQALTTSAANCPSGGLNNVIRLVLSPSNIIPGDYQVRLQRGTDGNTLLDLCGMETAPASLSFNVKEFVIADFTYNIPPTCSKTKVEFFHDGAHNVNSWNWSFGGGLSSTQQNPVITFNNPGNHPIRLIVSNGICSDTATDNIITSDVLKALFDAPDMACPGDTVKFDNKSTGNVDSWNWDFGNNSSSTQKQPAPIQYPITGRDAFYTVSLVARNATLNCEGKFSKTIQVLGNCLIRVPSAFSPNNDGLNDFLYPLNALRAVQLRFRVYDRFGQLVFSTADWKMKWDGRYRGQPLATGVYAWLLEYTDPSSKQRVFMKGTSLLVR